MRFFADEVRTPFERFLRAKHRTFGVHLDALRRRGGDGNKHPLRHQRRRPRLLRVPQNRLRGAPRDGVRENANRRFRALHRRRCSARVHTRWCSRNTGSNIRRRNRSNGEAHSRTGKRWHRRGTRQPRRDMVGVPLRVEHVNGRRLESGRRWRFRLVVGGPRRRRRSERRRQRLLGKRRTDARVFFFFFFDVSSKCCFGR